MIPVPQESVYLLDIKSKSYGYKRLLSQQYSYINKPENKAKIIEKAENEYEKYRIIQDQKHISSMDDFYNKHLEENK